MSGQTLSLTNCLCVVLWRVYKMKYFFKRKHPMLRSASANAISQGASQLVMGREVKKIK
jgi:hypothetical protein